MLIVQGRVTWKRASVLRPLAQYLPVIVFLGGYAAGNLRFGAIRHGVAPFDSFALLYLILILCRFSGCKKLCRISFGGVGVGRNA